MSNCGPKQMHREQGKTKKIRALLFQDTLTTPMSLTYCFGINYSCLLTSLGNFQQQQQQYIYFLKFLKCSSLHFLLSNLYGKYLKHLPVYSLNEKQDWNLSQIIPSCQRNSNCCKHKCQGSSYSDAEAIMQHSQRDHCIIISFWMWLPLCVRCLYVRWRRRKGIVSLTQSGVLC